MTIEENATLDVAQVLQGLRAMTAGLNNVTTAMTKLNDTGEKTKRTMKENFKDGAGVASRAGGPAGSFTSKLLGGGAMEGIFGKLAVAVSLGTLAFRGFQAAVDASLDRVRLMIEAQRSLRQVSEQADKAMENMAKRGEAQARGRTGAIAAGGQYAAEDIDLLAKTGLVTHEQATAGVTALYGRYGKTARAEKGVDIAYRGAQAGLDFDQVAEALTKMGPAIENTAAVDRMLGRMVQKQTGRVGDPTEILHERLQNINADPFLMEARKQQAARSGIAGLERQAFMSAGLGQKEAAEAANPLSAFLVEANIKFDQMIAELKLAATAQGNISAVMADVFGQGSFETQMRRALNARASAAGLPVDNTPSPAQRASSFAAEAVVPGFGLLKLFGVR
jgi:hypothetical protein